MSGQADSKVRGRLLGAIGAVILAAAFAPAPAKAQDHIAEWIEKLRAQDQREAEGSKAPASEPKPDTPELAAYKQAQAAFERQLAAYWSDVNDRRTERRRKRAAGIGFTADDYVAAFPPVYQGPPLTKEIQAALEQEAKTREPPRPTPTVEDFLAAAQSVYGFVPERISEVEFKRRYAREAMVLGLSRDQVLRVYALETGGIGTADMQAGINPITKQGRAISTALGYAQLLHANSVNEIVKHGPAFVARLTAMTAGKGVTPQRVQQLKGKIAVLRKMIANARSVPNEWSAHVRYAGTPPGLGIHALNLDGDIGPWLQVHKLADIKKFAAEQGRPTLTGAELELMNLAGPATGLEMMTTLGASAPTPNFFSRMGYERNSVVRNRTGRELLLELDRRMDGHLTKPGAVEFARVYDEIEGRAKAPASAAAPPAKLAPPAKAGALGGAQVR